MPKPSDIVGAVAVLAIAAIELLYLWLRQSGGYRSPVLVPGCITLLVLPVLWMRPHWLKKAALPMILAVLFASAFVLAIMDQELVAVLFAGGALYCVAIALKRLRQGSSQNQAESGSANDPLSPRVRDGFGFVICLIFAVWLWPRNYPAIWGLPLLVPPLWFIWRLGADFFDGRSRASASANGHR